MYFHCTSPECIPFPLTALLLLLFSIREIMFSLVFLIALQMNLQSFFAELDLLPWLCFCMHLLVSSCRWGFSATKQHVEGMKRNFFTSRLRAFSRPVFCNRGQFHISCLITLPLSSWNCSFLKLCAPDLLKLPVLHCSHFVFTSIFPPLNRHLVLSSVKLASCFFKVV